MDPLRVAAPLLLATAAALVGALAAGASERPTALLIEIDRETYSLQSRDLRDGSLGPSFQVVLGSPQHPTPRGDYPVFRVVHNPAWRPGPAARARGATESAPSRHGPMGTAKLPFAPGGIALHGGADPLLLGKPISLGCVRARDADLSELLQWLRSRGAIEGLETKPATELHQLLQVALRIRIR